MLMYLLLIGFLVIIGITFNNITLKFRGICHEKRIKVDILLATIVLVVFAGIRNTRLGVDLWNYENSFHWRSALAPLEVIDSINRERLYHLFAWFVSQFTQNFSIYLFIVACIFVMPMLAFIQKYSEIRWLSIWLYICMGFYTFSFSALRQSIAIALTIWTLYFIEEERYKKAVIIFLLACGFHTSAILCAPFFMLKKVKAGRKTIVYILAAAFIVYCLKDEMLALGSRILGREYGSMETGGKIWYIALIAMVVFGVVYRKHMWEQEIDRHLFLILSAATILMPICFSNPVLFRANYYYSIYLCIYMPRMVKAFGASEEKRMFVVSLMFVTIYYFFHSALPGGHLENYLFMWQ